ncbi:exonuclease domain-containing protein [Agrococcus sp. UYP33]
MLGSTTATLERSGETTTAAGPAFAVVDVETTGLSPRNHRVLELAVVRVDRRGTVVDEWVSRFNPDGPVGATHIHGITDADVRNAPRFHEMVPRISALVQGLPLVAHNARFDVSFLTNEFANVGHELSSVGHICTLEASHQLLPRLDRRRLPDCCHAAGVRLDGAHSALGDARATAGLLRHYLDLVGHDHRALLSNRPSMPRSTGGPARARVSEAELSRIRASQRRSAQAPLLTRVTAPSLTEVIEAGASEGLTAYLESVLHAVEDGLISVPEQSELDDVAEMFELDEADRSRAHRALLLAAAHRAVEDGRISREERQQLGSLATLLRQPEALVATVLDQALATRERGLTARLRALPADWQHGDPLRVGDRVVFTGCEERWRERVEERASALGIRVTSSVSRLTSALVTDGSVDGTKAASARLHGTRVLDPSTFELLLNHLQPRAETKPDASRRTDAAVATPSRPSPEPRPAQGPVPDPSAVRAWARAQGIPVGDRGRLAHELIEAYRQAH